jgi:hypothetical protein
MGLETKLYHYGLGAGLPFGPLNSLANTVNEVRNAGDVSRRRRAAQQLLAGSPWKGFMSKERGFAIVKPDTLPGTQAALAAAREVIEEARREGAKAKKNNPFIQCERPEAFVKYPALIEFAFSDAILSIVSDYYGMVPQVKEIGIWLTPPQTHQYSSQLYHLDKPEGQLVKLFLNVVDHDAAAGPLTFLPADVSNKVRKATNYEDIYYRKDGRIQDESVFSVCSPTDQVMLGGAAGSGGFADTSNCFHFGSRTAAGERKMLTVSFELPHRSRNPRTPLFDLVPEPKDELRRLVLSGARFHKA